MGSGWASRDRLFLWVGIGFLVAAGCFWLHEWRQSRSFQHATATITEMEARQDAKGNIHYFAHFRFRLPDDQIVQVVSTQPRSDSSFDDRETVPVEFRAGDPAGAVLAPAGHVYRAAIIFGIVGTVLFDIGAVMWIKRRQREMLLRPKPRL